MLPDERVKKKEIVIEYLSKLPVYKWAAKSVGIDEDTLKNWRDEDKDFSDRCEIAKSEAVEKFGRRATPDFMLSSIDPETFSKKDKLDVNINLKGLIQVTYDQADKTE